ncbi:crotonase/enoyl-CoA hydratase family protein [Nocardioides sp. dk4132]|uniref:crotonase/enoyl-CoA hydratase family protein n=1 Tax=unclassified Nocardioides TaxID=2615069 RepID=UPI001294DBAC|nr:MULTISPECIES: crotonase/enoyl-CoA hydratase family protein [unclassified Nocardioides]MQW75577.1 crotonase/enoyl-CoA hydratase family protein [Nocardioides sp. dk4132]QGA08483.1 crotonase/enoyl-CoA hydratase family protein [Nocardioides sp. dk884]
MATALPAQLTGFPRLVEATAEVAAPLAVASALVANPARHADWLSMHAAFREAPPEVASAGDAFEEQVTLMGIPADISWVVREAEAGLTALDGTGPMNLTLALRMEVAQDEADGVRFTIRAGIGGDPVEGPLGATVESSVKEALVESAERFAALAADLAADPAESTGSRFPQRSVVHERTGVRLDPRTPVLVGVGQVVQRRPDLEGGAEDPATLAARALRRAAEDSGAGEELLRAADAVYYVASASWTYRDAGRLIAEQLGAEPSETAMSAPYGGDAGQVLINTAGQVVADGRAEVVLVSGAEAGATLAAAQKQGIDLGWPVQERDVVPTTVLGSDREANNGPETAAGLTVPVYTYALMESALRAKAGETPEEHRRTITGLWSRLSEVAAGNEYAWLPQAHTPEQLATPDAGNRMISEPYPKLLCANLQVDLAAGVVVTSVAAATALGIAQDKWVFLHAGAAAYDEWFVSERRELAASPAIRAIGEAAFAHAGIGPDDVRHVDLYSCFPAAVQIAASELGLPLDDPERPLSVTGGLTFAGGPGNNYGTHAVATLVDRLRSDPAAYGLSTSLGWFVTKHALGIYSATPPRTPYRALAPVLLPERARPALDSYAGPGVVEAATAQYGRDGAPEAGILSVLTPEGARVLVRTTQPEVLDCIVGGDPLGLSAEVHDVRTLTITGQERTALPEAPEPPVLVERRGPVLVITLNRPERRNAIDLRTARLLERVIDAFEADPEARVAVLTGAGGTFSAGMDLKAAAAGQFALTEKRGPLGISALPIAKPVIAAVEGHALAGGCELALIADLVVASTQSQFGIPEPKRGLVAAAGGVMRLTERLPRNVAMELALTGNPMPATRLAELGLVNRLAEPGAVLDAALALAEEIVANAPLSVQVSRRIVAESPTWAPEEAFSRQSDLASVAVTSEDAAEGIAAFAEHRAPVWRGR